MNGHAVMQARSLAQQKPSISKEEGRVESAKAARRWVVREELERKNFSHNIVAIK